MLMPWWMHRVYRMHLRTAKDKRGVMRSGSGFELPDLITYIRPRTMGMQLEYAF
jgi:hypothetical protein